MPDGVTITVECDPPGGPQIGYVILPPGVSLIEILEQYEIKWRP
jgi:hypothetical protein